MGPVTFEPAGGTGPITVERRFADRPFEAVGTVPAGGPYTFSEADLAPGTYTYRLRRAGDGGRTLTSASATAEV